MKKLLLSLLFALVALTGLQAQTIWDGTANTEWYDETSTEFEISTAEQLAGLAKLVNNGNDFSGKTILLTADIVLNDTSNWENRESSAPENTWSPIGNWPNNLFSGTFDGQGHTVSGIYINSENYHKGLFEYNEGTIKNIGVTESYIKGGYYVGGVCGYNYGSISDCYNSGTISGNSYVGGVCGYNDGTISDCYNSGTVSGNEYVGGVCGRNYDTISGCYNAGTVSGNEYVGGVCGENYGTISNCYYLQGTAEGGINGSDISGQAAAKTAEQFASGEVCWLLNESSDENPVWFQTLATDDYPVLDEAHTTVYAIGNCPNDINNSYSNQGPSNVGEHTDNDHDFRCDYCGMVMLQEPELSEGVYQISNFAELYWFAGLVNGTLSGVEQNIYANAALKADIIINENVLDAEGNLTESTDNLLVWSPIGNSSNKFYGTFNGQGHSVNGIYINSEDDYQGLFGYNMGTIKNIGVTESYIKGDSYIGGVCGSNRGSISNCYNSGTVSGDRYVGGVCGDNDGSISNSSNIGTVNGNNSIGEYRYVGGVCGANRGTISNCYNSGEVSGIGRVGGVCGYNDYYGTISNCYYLQGTAEGGINGNDESGQAEVKTAEQFASGEVCWLLNESSDENPVWFQTLATDNYPVLDEAHATVYVIGNCPNDINNSYSNQGPSQIGAHTDNDNDGRCDFCRKIMISEPTQKDGVYQISNRAELYWFAGLVNGTLSGVEQNIYANAVLTADIIINENVLEDDGNLTANTEDLLVWNPIGKNYDKTFRGTFDGQGHTVSGIYINSENDSQGLFGINSGTIKNAGVTESYIKGGSCVGGVCGYNNSTISNCYNSGTVSGNSDIGGVCGYNYDDTISNCYNSGEVSGNSYVGGVCGDNSGSGTISNCYNSGTVSGNYYVGGVCGDNDGSISNSSNIGTVNGNNSIGEYRYVGGVCGANRGTISNCYNSGEVSGNSYVGGVCGNNYGTISNCHNSGTVSGNYYVGGVCGYNDGSISNCHNSGTVNGNESVGGVCGDNSGTISNCYNSGTVSGNYNYVGGVCGDNDGSISNCYNSGTVSGRYYDVGGVCGDNYDTISNCYYLQGSAEGGINGSDISGQAAAKTAEQFASGEVCWLLNERQSEGAWGQKLGTDPCPVLGGPAVFKDGETYYNEEGSAIVETNSEQASFVIVPENLTINIYGSDGEATVYNLAGNIVYQGIERIIPVPNPGMYMVRIGNEVQKTIVR